ncbi:MAG: hypothetical protein GX241_01595 [Ruminococcaceae bacterium]|nr:hypothetical protein [Oscillospiraceae bacterium]
MGIIRYIITLLTFPGALFAGFMEHLACRMYKIPVEYSKYIQKNELSGHVEHMLADQKGSFGVCFLPHIITLLCGISFVLPASMNLFYLGKINIVSLVFMYVGISFLSNSFPLLEHAINMWDHLFKGSAKPVSKIFLAVPATVMYGGAYLEKYGISLLTSIAFSVVLPYVIALFI